MEGGGRSAELRAEINTDTQDVADDAENVDKWSSVKYDAINNCFNKGICCWRRKKDHALRDRVV
jgi:hypothetical protein